MEPVGDLDTSVTDWLVLALRAFSQAAQPFSAKQWKGERQNRPRPSDWVLVFDTETKTSPDQRLRFGAYQLRHKGRLAERGVFYDPNGLTADELETLKSFMLGERPTEAGERLYIRTRDAFVEEVFFKKAFAVGAQIVGLNLPFDLSRIALRHVNARGSMKGGFSFVLSENPRLPKVAVKHLSARASRIRFTGSKAARPWERHAAEQDKRSSPDRGYFVDLKTAGGALVGGSHSLESLGALLGIASPKKPTEDHDAPLTPDYIRYALRDVEATWQCFEALSARLSALQLADVGLYDLYSEASLGKAYLNTMGVRPWRVAQPDFPRPLIGHIMSAYLRTERRLGHKQR